MTQITITDTHRSATSKAAILHNTSTPSSSNPAAVKSLAEEPTFNKKGARKSVALCCTHAYIYTYIYISVGAGEGGRERFNGGQHE